MWRKVTLLNHWWECKLIQPLWRTVWRFLKKLVIKLAYGPAISLLGIHSEKTTIQKDTCIPKVHLVKAMVFPVVMYICESWVIKKAEHQKIDDF